MLAPMEVPFIFLVMIHLCFDKFAPLNLHSLINYDNIGDALLSLQGSTSCFEILFDFPFSFATCYVDLIYSCISNTFVLTRTFRTIL